jgi:hypothetical protein
MWPVLNPNAELGTFVSAVQDIRAYRAKRRLIFDRNERYMTRVPPRRLLQRLGKPLSTLEAAGNAAAVAVLQLGCMAMTASLLSGAGQQPVIAIAVILTALLLLGARRLVASRHGKGSLLILMPVAAGTFAVGASLTTLTALCGAGSITDASTCSAVSPADNLGVQTGVAAVVQDVVSRIGRFLASSPWAWAPYVAGLAVHAAASAVYVLRGAWKHRRWRLQSAEPGGAATATNPMHASSAALASSTARARTMVQWMHADKPSESRASDSGSIASLWTSTDTSVANLEDLVDALNEIITRHPQEGIQERDGKSPAAGRLTRLGSVDLRRDQHCKLVLEGLLQLIQAQVDEKTEVGLLRKQRDRQRERESAAPTGAPVQRRSTEAAIAERVASQRELLGISDIRRLKTAAATIVRSAQVEIRSWSDERRSRRLGKRSPGAAPSPEESPPHPLAGSPVGRQSPSLDALGKGFGERLSFTGEQAVTGLQSPQEPLLDLEVPALVPAAGWLAHSAAAGERNGRPTAPRSVRAAIPASGSQQSRRGSAAARSTHRLGVLGALYAESGDWDNARVAHNAMNQLRSRRSIIAAGNLLADTRPARTLLDAETGTRQPAAFVQTRKTRRSSLRELPALAAREVALERHQAGTVKAQARRSMTGAVGAARLPASSAGATPSAPKVGRSSSLRRLGQASQLSGPSGRRVYSSRGLRPPSGSDQFRRHSEAIRVPIAECDESADGDDEEDDDDRDASSSSHVNDPAFSRRDLEAHTGPMEPRREQVESAVGFVISVDGADGAALDQDGKAPFRPRAPSSAWSTSEWVSSNHREFDNDSESEWSCMDQDAASVVASTAWTSHSPTGHGHGDRDHDDEEDGDDDDDDDDDWN